MIRACSCPGVLKPWRVNRSLGGFLVKCCWMLCLLLAGLASSTTAQSLDKMRYNEVQFKAAHNSIDRNESLAQQLGWDSQKHYQSGCRGIELDIVQDPDSTRERDTWRFAVRHGGAYRSSSPQLRTCLREIRT